MLRHLMFIKFIYFPHTGSLCAWKDWRQSWYYCKSRGLFEDPGRTGKAHWPFCSLAFAPLPWRWESPGIT